MAPMSVTKALELAMQHHRSGRLAEAESFCHSVLSQEPGNADALNLLSIIARQSGRIELAVEFAARGAAAHPHIAEFHANLGEFSRLAGKPDMAVASFQRAIELKPNEPTFHNHLGMALGGMRQYEMAAREYQRAIELKPDYAEAYACLSGPLRQLDRLAEADAAIRTAIRLQPDMPAAQHNLAVVLADQGRFQEAIAAYSRAIELKPDSVEARCHLGELYLLLGDFERGWKEHEWRLPIAYPNNPRRWDGGELNGKTILLYGEQGFGDVIQFVRYVPMVAEKGGRIILVCHEKLVRLLAGVPHIAQIVSLKQPTPAFDVFCPLLSLPLALGTTLHNIPANVPYLKSERPRLAKKPHVLRVGLAWAGNPEHWDDLRRSIPLEQFAPFSAIPGIEFYSLQIGPATRQKNDSSAPLPLIDLTADLHDFADTAAIVANLDLVISVDTAAAHLAGAMGKPVWILLAAMPDWRWMLKREDSPWYPTMRLFRQESTGSWSHVIRRVVDSLAEFRQASTQLSIGDRGQPQS